MNRLFRARSAVLGVAAAVVAAATAAPLRAQAATPLAWSHDWKSAQESAAAAKKPILVVVMKDEEPGCTRMLEKVYADPEVRLKLANYVLVPVSPATHHLIEVEQNGQRGPSCPQFVGALCSEHQAFERELHARLVEPDPTDVVLAPQNLVLDAKGTLLLRRPYEMKRQGFLEFLEYGLALFADPTLATQPGIHSPVVQRLEDAIVKAQNDDARERATRELLDEPSPEREVAFLDAVERVSGAEHKEPIVRAAGYPEYKVWAPTIVKLLDSNVTWVRDCAVVTLEEIGDPLAAAPLFALWEKEKDGETKKDVIRALGPCGGGRPAVKTLLLAQLDAAKDPWRSAAAMSLGFFVKGDAEVAAALEKRYAKEKNTTVRLAILAAFFQSGDATQRERVETMTKNEKDDALANFASIVRTRLSGDPAELAKGLGGGKGGGPAGPSGPGGSGGPSGPGGRGFVSLEWQFLKLTAPLYADDKIVRNRIKLWKRPGKGGKGG